VSGRRRPRRLLVVTRLVGVVGLLVGWSPVTGATSSGASTSPYTITVAQISGLTDGTPVPVTVTSADPADDPVGWVDLRVCRPGVDYTSYTVVETRGNCGFSPGSSAYTSPTGSATQDFPGEPSGATSFPDNFIAGVGSAQFAGFSLTCDATHPCDLVVSVFTSQTASEGQTAQDVQAFALTFLPFGTVAGCGATATDAIQTVSSDRLVESYTDWSRQICALSSGGGQAPTVNTFVDEGGAFGAIASFANGDADMAYAAGGYDLPGLSVSTGRPYVAVPLALNAVVVAASGGEQVAAYTPKGSAPVTYSSPFAHLVVTAGQAAALFGGGYLSPPQTASLDAANPELQPGAQVVPYIPPGGSTFIYPQAVAGASATTVFSTSYFRAVAPKSWTSGPYAHSGQKANVRRGVLASFALPGEKEPAFNSLGLYSHRTDLERSALPYAGLGPLPLWVLTDRATATQLGFTVASLGSSPSTAVEPTEAMMDAAVAAMKVLPDGTREPDPSRARTGYPLTFVEYALVPTEPLVDAACHVRTGSEKLMIKWLRFLTGRGRTDMAPGLEPLTPSLRAAAAVAIVKVGRAPATGACAPKKTVVAPPPATTEPVATPPLTAPPASVPPPGRVVSKPHPSKVSRRRTTTTHPAPSRATTAPAADSQLVAAQIPRLATRNRTSWALPSVGLLVLGVLTGGMALRTSGRTRRRRGARRPPPSTTL
jgi:hypothetical protein